MFHQALEPGRLLLALLPTTVLICFPLPRTGLSIGTGGRWRGDSPMGLAAESASGVSTEKCSKSYFRARNRRATGIYQMSKLLQASSKSILCEQGQHLCSVENGTRLSTMQCSSCAAYWTKRGGGGGGEREKERERDTQPGKGRTRCF